MNILVTGSAGFIGYHLLKTLLEKGCNVIGVDIFNDYYDPELKRRRNALLEMYGNFRCVPVDITNFKALRESLAQIKIDLIIHLAAQAGVRYSLENPWIYEQTNILGTLNICELAKDLFVRRVLYASSSSVYGSNTKIPFSETDNCDSPVSVYAASKKSCEVIARSYKNLYGIETVGLRFFTVYGTYGRPDMALFSFAKKILQGKPISLFNQGKMKRDFTHVSDVVDGIVRIAFAKELQHDIYNIGCDNPEELMYMVTSLERALDKKAEIRLEPMQKGDVLTTYADMSRMKQEFGFSARVKMDKGVAEFGCWFKENFDWLKDLKDS